MEFFAALIGTVIGVFVLTAPVWLIALYFLPGIIVTWRRADHQVAIWFLTILLGWTVLGWLACFIWACVSKSNYKERLEAYNQLKEEGKKGYTGSIPQI